jgi:steroid 5-alpha reductase family enzyme
MSLDVIAQNAGLVGVLMFTLWLVSIPLRNVSIVDPWWSVGFLLITAHSVISTGSAPAKGLLLAMVGAWSTRLWLHLLLRSRGKPEDPRYAGFRQRFGPERYWWLSLFQVFLLQGVLVVIISAPLQLAGSAPGGREIGLPEICGLALFVVGFGFEVVGDRQLQAFRTDPSKKGKVLDTGLWRYSRHPNYFGEALLWWGLWVFCLPAPWAWASVFSPALMTFLLMRVSGVPMLDAHLAATRPGYKEYLERTSGFFPRRPTP